jgi:hypothetical protein
MNLGARIKRLEAAARRSRGKEHIVYIVPSWAFPRTKDGGGHKGDAVFIIPGPGDPAERGKS